MIKEKKLIKNKLDFESYEFSDFRAFFKKNLNVFLNSLIKNIKKMVLSVH